MSDIRRTIPITIDVQAGRPVVSSVDVTPVPTPITLYHNTLIIYRCTLINSDKSAVTLPEAATWLFGINDDFDHDPLVSSLTADFNISDDWAGLNPATGKIVWRADLTTPELAAALASKTGPTIMWCNLWMGTTAGWDLKCQWQVNVMPVAISPATATVRPGLSYVTIEQANAIYVPTWGDQARWRWRDGGWQYLFEEDAQWRALAPRMIDGHPTIAWSDPVSP